MAEKMEETIDLTTCSICFYVYDDQERKPKFLSCHHTACQKCLDPLCVVVSLGKTQHFVVSCPLCRQNTTWLSGGAHSLPTNPYALHMIQLSKKSMIDQLQLGSNWCLTCAALISPKCQKEHCTIFIESGKIKDAEALQGLVDTYKSNLAQTIVKRKEINKDLHGMLKSIQLLGDQVKDHIEANDIELAKVTSLLSDVESQFSSEASAHTFKKSMEQQAEKSQELLRHADDAVVRNLIRIRVDLRNSANELIPTCARLSNGFGYARSEIKDRPGLRSKLNLISHLVVSINKEETFLQTAIALPSSESLSSSKLLAAKKFSSTLSVSSTCTVDPSFAAGKLKIPLSLSLTVFPTTFIIKARQSKEILGEISIQSSFDPAFISALTDLSLSKPVISNHVTQVEPEKVFTIVCENAKFRPPLPQMDLQPRALQNLDVGICVLTVENGRLRRWSLSFLLADLNEPTKNERAFFGTVTNGDEVLRSLCLRQGSEKALLNFVLEKPM